MENSFLRERKIKVTKARLDILNIFLNIKESLSAEEIFIECKKRGNNINLSTVYRTMDIFLENNIIDKFLLEEGISVYKLHKNTHKHKIECDICHKEIILDCPIRKIEEMIRKETGFKVINHSLKMNGICNECEKESQK